MATTEQNRQGLITAVSNGSIAARIEDLRRQQREYAPYKYAPYGYDERICSAVAAVSDNPSLYNDFAKIVDTIPRDKWPNIVNHSRYWDLEARIKRLLLKTTTGDEDITALMAAYGIEDEDADVQ